jgi:hypothetical protein
VVVVVIVIVIVLLLMGRLRALGSPVAGHLVA